MKMDKPKIQEQLLEPETMAFLESNYKLIENITLDQQEASKVSFENVVFRHVTISESTLEQFEFTDVRFEHCDFSNVNLSGAFMHRIEWLNCKFVGTDFSNSRLQNVSFLHGLGDYSNFRFAHLKQVSFSESTLIGADFAYLALQKWSSVNVTSTKLP